MSESKPQIIIEPFQGMDVSKKQHTYVTKDGTLVSHLTFSDMIGINNATAICKKPKRRDCWNRIYAGKDMDDLKKEASQYFIKVEGKKSMKYIGKKEEYFKWYNILNREKKIANKKAWREKNLQKDIVRSKIKSNESAFKTKIQAFRMIASSLEINCCNCGCNDIRALTVNHKNGKGREDAQFNKSNFGGFYLAIVKGKRSVSDLEIRCYNCNIIYEYDRGTRSLPSNWQEIINKI